MRERWGGVENLRRLAREAELSPATAMRIKSQQTAVGLDVLDRVAAVFDVEPWELLAPKNNASTLRLLSPEALDVAMSLDALRDPLRRAKAYALTMHAIRALDVTEDPPGAAPAPSPAPKKAPGLR